MIVIKNEHVLFQDNVLGDESQRCNEHCSGYPGYAARHLAAQQAQLPAGAS